LLVDEMQRHVAHAGEVGRVRIHVG
jgi:hypothetical protein